MKKALASKIIEIANELDQVGLYSEAEVLTNLVRMAQMPGSPNPAAGVAQKPQQVAPPPAPAQSQVQPAPVPQWAQNLNLKPDWSKMISNPMPPTTYNGPQTPYPPAGWYQAPVKPQTPAFPATTGNQAGYQSADIANTIMNMQMSPVSVVKRNPDGTMIQQNPMTFGQFADQQLLKQQQQQNQGNADATIQSARQKQMAEMMEHYKRLYWKLWGDMQNSQMGDGHPQSYY